MLVGYNLQNLFRIHFKPYTNIQIPTWCYKLIIAIIHYVSTGIFRDAFK